uniref:Uncharacterized protein n=1 Tax=Fagus sylvatica TaxID=28930 RepID=A0A2N9FNW8_FAGSY
MKAYLARNHMKLAIVLMVMILLLTSAAARGGQGGGRSGGGHVTGGSQVGMGFFPSNWFSILPMEIPTTKAMHLP